MPMYDDGRTMELLALMDLASINRTKQVREAMLEHIKTMFRLSAMQDVCGHVLLQPFVHGNRK